MSKIAFFCIPAFGHTNPTLEVVRELINRGNEVWYYSYDMLKDEILSTGAKYISCDAYDIQMTLNPEDYERMSKDLALSMEILVNTTLALDNAIMEEMKNWHPDCIVADSMAVWGKLVASKLQIPFISSTTTFAFNRYSSKIMKQSLLEGIRMMISMSKANKSLQKLRDKGYSVKNALSIIANSNDTNTIVYTSPEFQPCAETFSNKYTFVGPSIRPYKAMELKSNRELIYISLGTVNNQNISFYQNCIRAFRNSRYEVIISVGNMTDVDKLGEIPENITIKKYVDQLAVLQQAKLFITHCGMNSVNEALYFKVPLILFPQTKEQEGVAYRVHELDAGIYLENCDSDTIIEAVETINTDIKYRESAERIANSFHRCGGPKLAADKVIEVAEK